MQIYRNKLYPFIKYESVLTKFSSEISNDSKFLVQMYKTYILPIRDIDATYVRKYAHAINK
jgi:hypothetical protein